MSGSVADNIYPHSKDGVAQSGSEDGHFQVQAAFPFPKVFPLMRCINKTEALTLPNCPCAGFSVQNLSETAEIRWGRNTADEAPFIDRNYPADSRGMVIYPRQTFPLPFTNTNAVSIVGEENSEFQVVAYVNTTSDPIISTDQPAQITPPVVLSTSPADNAVGVNVTASIIIVMDSDMDPSTIQMANIMLSPDFECDCALDPGDPRKIVIDPVSNLAFSTVYTITLSAVRDTDNHKISPAYSFDFTTAGAPDVTAPLVSSRSPTAGATGIAVTSSATITFNEEMNVATINNTTCRILLTAGLVNQAATVTLSADKKTVTIDPTASLAATSGHTLRAVGGGSGVKDIAGNALAATSDSTFTTAASDVTAPTITNRSPASAATGVSASANIVVTFSEAMLSASITSTTVKLTKTSDGTVVPGALSLASNVATLNPTASLANSTQYTVTVLGGASGVKDLASNPLAATSTWNFTVIAASYTVVYNVSGDWWNTLDDSDMLDGVKVTSSSGSGLYGKIIKKVTVTLKRTGSGIGTITCRICPLDNYNTVRQAMGTMSGDSVTTSSSGAQYTFENASATYAMQLNDCLVIHQGDGDSSNYISIWILEDDAWAYGFRVHSNDVDNFTEEEGEEFAAIIYT